MLKLLTSLRPFARYLLIACGLIIIILSSIPNIPTLKIHTHGAEIRVDYLMHFGEYGLLTFLTFLSFAGNELKITNKKIVIIILTIIMFAVLDELHQKLIPGRTCSLKDTLSDIGGVVIGAIFVIVIFSGKINGTAPRFKN
jgi:VanZ family protein